MSTTSDYLLLIRGTQWQTGQPAAEVEQTLGRFLDWFQSLQDQGKLKGANPLKHHGKIVSGAAGRSVIDGPFAESKEAIGGYFLVSVSDMDEAVAIAQDCPILQLGWHVEVRPIADECPIMKALRENSGLALA